MDDSGRHEGLPDEIGKCSCEEQIGQEETLRMFTRILLAESSGSLILDMYIPHEIRYDNGAVT